MKKQVTNKCTTNLREAIHFATILFMAIYYLTNVGTAKSAVVENFLADTVDISLYRIFELPLINDTAYDNKFTDVELTATYTSPSGKIYNFTGFFDGDGNGGGDYQNGNVWKLRFMPNELGEWGNTAFVQKNILGHGALGDFFNTQLGGTIKMGDTPSVARLLYSDPEDPSQPSWGGQFVHAWTRPHVVFNRVTTSADSIEEFSILELNLPLGTNASDPLKATLDVGNQSLAGLVDGDKIKFMFCPKASTVFNYKISSNSPKLDGQKGSITAYLTPEENKLHPDPDLPNWWVDDPSRELTEGKYIGAKTVSRWREEFLKDFKERMDRCKSPAKY